jgi:parallel beta-helix repeat protein
VVLSDVQIEPAFVELFSGDSILFLATAYDLTSDEVSAEFSWEADGGSVGPQGLYVAGSEEGEFAVSAEPTSIKGKKVAKGHEKRGAARVRIKNRDSANLPPEAAFAHSCSGLDCQFDASASSDSDGVITRHDWQFGDGGTETGAVVTHRYSGAGQYSVVLRVYDDSASEASLEQAITVDAVPADPANQLPTASIRVSCTDLSCELDGSASTDPDGSIASYDWKLGDGTIGTGVTFEHTYAQAGTYAIELKVMDDKGGEASAGKSITLEAPNVAPTASFSFECVELTCAFDASGSSDTDGIVADYSWQFGDGTTGTSAVRSHTYGAEGVYSVSLQVRDDDGATDQTTRSVSVSAPPPDEPPPPDDPPPPDGPPPGEDPLNTTIYPGEDIQPAVDANPAGASFLLKAGVHRMQSVVPKAGNVFAGEPGAVLSGARHLTDFQREGGLWVAAGQTQENPRHGPNPYGPEVCFDDSPSCVYPEDLFFDDVPLHQVLSKGEVGPGEWYFDYAADRIYFYDDPAGRVVETSVTPIAFRADNRDDLVIEGLVIEKYANPAQIGAIHTTNSDRVRVSDNEIRLNHGAGVLLCCGNDMRLLNNEVHHQGQLGVGSYGATDLVAEGNRIHNNNHAGYWSSWEGGGSKFAVSTRLVLRNNVAYENRGKGLWTDGDNIYTLVELNEVHDNTEHGIFHEIGYEAVFRNNTVYRNGWHGIVIDSSPDVEVTGNDVRENGWAKNYTLAQIFGRDPHRGKTGRHGPRGIWNLNMHGNTVEGHPLAGLNGPTETFDQSQNNRFEGNTYIVSTSQPFWSNGQALTREQWQAMGFDTTSEFK